VFRNLDTAILRFVGSWDFKMRCQRSIRGCTRTARLWNWQKNLSKIPSNMDNSDGLDIFVVAHTRTSLKQLTWKLSKNREKQKTMKNMEWHDRGSLSSVTSSCIFISILIFVSNLPLTILNGIHISKTFPVVIYKRCIFIRIILCILITILGLNADVITMSFLLSVRIPWNSLSIYLDTKFTIKWPKLEMTPHSRLWEQIDVLKVGGNDGKGG